VTEPETVPEAEPWLVERLVPGGEGFGRAPDGRAAFIPGGLPGDRIRPTRLTEKKRMVRVEAFQLVEGGPERRADAPCEYAARCGGCDWMFLEREAQLRWKRALVADAVRRIARVEVEVDPTVTAGPEVGYRSRIRLHADDAGHLGMYARGSHRIVDLQRCAVADEAINEALPVLRVGRPVGVCEVELRAAPLGPRVVVRSHPADKVWALGGLIPAVEPDVPPPVQRWPLPLDLELAVPATVFVQVNPAVNVALIDALLAGASARGATNFVDLYCGAGNFALPLAGAGLTGSGIEANPAAIAAARDTAEAARLSSRVSFLAGRVNELLPPMAKTAGVVDLVVLDPPRAGAKEAIAPLLKLAPKWIAAVSCDPATLARDLKMLLDGGYAIESVTPFDMFPQTHHVEVLVWLGRTA